MFFFGSFVFFGYLAWRLIWPLRFRASLRVAMATLLLLVCCQHLINRLLFGTMFSPEWPHAVVLLLGIAFGAVVITGLLLLVVDILAAGAQLARRRRPTGIHRRDVKAAVVFVGTALSLTGVLIAIAPPRIHRLTLTVPGLPSALHGYRVAQLTDLHLSKLFQRDWATAVVSRVNALRPDLIVITGDTIDGTVARRQLEVEALRPLKAIDGTVVIPGNHEYYFDGLAWLAEYRRLGFRVLANEHLTVTRQNNTMVIAGITDLMARQYGLPGPDIDAALLGRPEGALTILLSHRPLGARQNAEHRIVLQLSGHTHGGMMPGLAWLTARANDGYVSGLYHVGTMLLFVSNGTGIWNGFPVRLSAPPEIVEITLQ